MKHYNINHNAEKGLGQHTDERGTITDSSPHKQGKYTPLTRIPICSDDEFAKHDAPYALILSWNIGEGLRRAILNITPHTRFLSE